ncbi:hypothetical protein M407DRAFT_31123 [Tulasnella calospora MUT 4182]|uniref:Uncharacterized protein n=1 Tax=Tulasnella calospora MUT 4182 TaxID=1051891 RepID=A0A0C3LCM3_9AGAM|nr:hypothetical protein M407DRAFT_31123 [Tulasnella calospora MUT 4182]
MRFSIVSSIATVLLSGFFAVASPVHVDLAPAPAPELLPRAALTIPAILANGQTQVDSVTQQIRKVVPFGGNTTQQVDTALVSSLLSRVQVTIDNVNTQLLQVADQPWDVVGGGADPATAQYALADLAISAVKAVAPVSAITETYPELQKSVDAVTQSVVNIGPVALKINWTHVWGYVLIGVGAVCTAIGTALL